MKVRRCLKRRWQAYPNEIPKRRRKSLTLVHCYLRSYRISGSFPKIISYQMSQEPKDRSAFVQSNPWETSLGSHLATLETCLEEKERCSGSFHLAVGFLVIKDDSISERPSLWQWRSRYTAHLDGTYLSRNFATLGPVTDSRHLYKRYLWRSGCMTRMIGS